MKFLHGSPDEFEKDSLFFMQYFFKAISQVKNSLLIHQISTRGILSHLFNTRDVQMCVYGWEKQKYKSVYRSVWSGRERHTRRPTWDSIMRDQREGKGYGKYEEGREMMESWEVE